MGFLQTELSHQDSGRHRYVCCYIGCPASAGFSNQCFQKFILPLSLYREEERTVCSSMCMTVCCTDLRPQNFKQSHPSVYRQRGQYCKRRGWGGGVWGETAYKLVYKSLQWTRVLHQCQYTSQLREAFLRIWVRVTDGNRSKNEAVTNGETAGVKWL